MIWVFVYTGVRRDDARGTHKGNYVRYVCVSYAVICVPSTFFLRYTSAGVRRCASVCVGANAHPKSTLKISSAQNAQTYYKLLSAYALFVSCMRSLSVSRAFCMRSVCVPHQFQCARHASSLQTHIERTYNAL